MRLDFLRISKPGGTLHTVTIRRVAPGTCPPDAFDLLTRSTRRRATPHLRSPPLILKNNIYGTEIDPRAGALAAFALTMKAAAKRKLFLKNPVTPNICVLDTLTFRADELSYLVTADGDPTRRKRIGTSSPMPTPSALSSSPIPPSTFGSRTTSRRLTTG